MRGSLCCTMTFSVLGWVRAAAAANSVMAGVAGASLRYVASQGGKEQLVGRKHAKAGGAPVPVYQV